MGKEDFRKRNRKHRKKKKGTNPIKTVITVLSAISLIYMMLFIMMKSTEEAEIKAQNERIIKVGAKSENNKIQDIKNGKTNNPNQIKNSKTLIEDTIKKKAMKSTIEESITIIRNQNKCSNQLENQAITKFLQQQEKKMEKVILEKIMNLEIIQNNRDILENKINNQNKEKNPADIAYPGDGYDPANIKDHNKDQEISFNLENVLSKILELQITCEKITPNQMNKANDKTSGPGEPNSEYIEETNAHDYVRNELNTEPNSNCIEKTDARDYVRNELNTEPNSEYIEKTNAHDYVRNKLNTESAGDKKSEEKTVNLDCTKVSEKDHQITFDLEHVLSKTLGSRNKNGQKGTDKASEYSSSFSGSARMKDINSNKINESPAPSSKESIQLENSEHLTNLLAEIQNDLIKLDYIKNYNNPKHSMTEESQEYINSTQAKSTQTTYFLVQSDMDHMLISEENLGKITLTNPQINTDVGIQLIQANPIN